jgi:crossover junction endodeoxyribonuclease RuvC
VTYVLAIDPGLDGGWALRCAAASTPFAAGPLPVAGRYTDGMELVHRVHIELCALNEVGVMGDDDMALTSVVMERQAPQASDGPRSIATTMCSYGELRGTFRALRWPLRLVDPKEWKNLVLKGTRRDKAAAIDFARASAPHIDLFPGRRKNAHDGIADAICIAEYACRTLGAKT